MVCVYDDESFCFSCLTSDDCEYYQNQVRSQNVEA